MPRSRKWYRIEAERLWELLERLSLRDGLSLWEALGEDPRTFPRGSEAARRQAIRRIQRDKMSQGIVENAVTKCHTNLRAGEEKPPTKTRKRRDKMSQRIAGNAVTKRHAPSDPAGALAASLGGWRAGLIYRARREQNVLIQKLAHGHRDVLLEMLNLAEGLPLPKRVPTTLAWLPEFAAQLERLGDAEVQRVFLEVRKKAPQNPLSYAARVLEGRRKEEQEWQPTGESF